jgi:hypothetical protein
VPPADLQGQARPHVQEGGPAHHRGHAVVGLDRRRGRTLGPGHHDLGDQVLDRTLGDVDLAQPRQHVADEGQVGGAGADHQHPVPGQPLPVLVEQERGPVQADRGLAGAGAALDHDRLGQRRPDQVVLLWLDGGDDVAHRPDARPLDLGHQHPVGGGHGLRLVQQVEDLVLDRGQGAAPVAEPAPGPDAVPVGRAGPVEGMGQPGPPVDHHRVALGVADVPAPHVEPRLRRVGAVVVVQPPEEQPGPPVVGQRRDPLPQLPLHRLRRIPVGPGGRQRPRPLPHRRQTPPGVLQHLPLGQQLTVGQRLQRSAHTSSPPGSEGRKATRRTRRRGSSPSSSAARASAATQLPPQSSRSRRCRVATRRRERPGQWPMCEDCRPDRSRRASTTTNPMAR